MKWSGKDAKWKEDIRRQNVRHSHTMIRQTKESMRQKETNNCSDKESDWKKAICAASAFHLGTWFIYQVYQSITKCVFRRVWPPKTRSSKALPGEVRPGPPRCRSTLDDRNAVNMTWTMQRCNDAPNAKKKLQHPKLDEKIFCLVDLCLKS